MIAAGEGNAVIVELLLSHHATIDQENRVRIIILSCED